MVLGLILSILASACFGVSIAVQKYSLSSMRDFSVKKIAKDKKWVLAFLIGIAGILVYLVALNFEPISTVQPLTSLSIVIPIIAGVVWFKEKLEVKKWAFL